MAHIKTYVEAPKSAHIRQGLFDLAQRHGVSFSAETDKGWFKETVYFTVDGDDAAVKAFARDVNRALSDWNGDHT